MPIETRYPFGILLINTLLCCLSKFGGGYMDPGRDTKMASLSNVFLGDLAPFSQKCEQHLVGGGVSGEEDVALQAVVLCPVVHHVPHPVHNVMGRPHRVRPARDLGGGKMVGPGWKAPCGWTEFWAEETAF